MMKFLTQCTRTIYSILSQARMPSPHVWLNFSSPASPQCLNQAPPRVQQLRLPDFVAIPHFRHSGLAVADVDTINGGVVAAARAGFWNRNTSTQASGYISLKRQAIPTCNRCPLEISKFHLRWRAIRISCQGCSHGRRLKQNINTAQDRSTSERTDTFATILSDFRSTLHIYRQMICRVRKLVDKSRMPKFNKNWKFWMEWWTAMLSSATHGWALL